MLPFICYIQNRKIQRNRKQIKGYQGVGDGGGEWGVILLNDSGVFLWGDEKSFETKMSTTL